MHDDETSRKKTEENDERLFKLIIDFLKDKWNGTTMELYDALKTIDLEANIEPHMIKKRLYSNIGLFKDANILFYSCE